MKLTDQMTGHAFAGHETMHRSGKRF